MARTLVLAGKIGPAFNGGSTTHSVVSIAVDSKAIRDSEAKGGNYVQGYKVFDLDAVETIFYPLGDTGRYALGGVFEDAAINAGIYF